MKKIFTVIIVIFLLGFHVNKAIAQHSASPFTPYLNFIENRGQWDENIQFAAEIPGGQLKIMGDQLNYSFYDTKAFSEKYHQHFTHSPDNLHPEGISKEIKTVSVQMIFSGASKNAKIQVDKPEQQLYNYYLGNDKNHWATGCKAYSEITYSELYPGVKLRLYSNENLLKYDLILQKGASPEQIKFRYQGLEKIELKNHKLYCQTSFNTFVENKPYAYQISAGGQKREVVCQFELKNNEVSFKFPNGYDAKKALIIDPELIFSTFSGSTADNFGYTACFDDQGNLYSGGIVFGPGFPVTDGSAFKGGRYDIGILKYDSLGENLKYATYIGGIAPDTPHSLIVNNQNELLILGTTGSTNYPTTDGAYDRTYNGGTSFFIFDSLRVGSDLTLTKLDENGAIIASTLVGGNGNDGILKLRNINLYDNALIQNYGDYIRGDIIVDDDDNIYVASSSDNADFPVSSTIQPTYGGGNSDAVIFKMNNDLTLLEWSTYLGGQNDDATYSIKLDRDNNVYVGGGTNSSDFPTTMGVENETSGGGIDGFIAKFDVNNDVLLASTYLGTSAYDQVYFIDLDESGNVYALGQTRGNYPVSADVYNNPNSAQFIHCLGINLDTTIFSTVFGSGTLEPNISPTAFLVNECENIFLSGWGGQTNNGNSSNNGNTNGLPVTDDAIFPNTDGSDFYLMALSADGKQLLYGTYFGSANNQNNGDHVDGGTSRFDKKGIVYQSVCSCGGSGDNFPTTPGAWSNVNRGVNINNAERCNNAVFKFDLATLEARLQTDSKFRNEPGFHDGCAPLEVVFYNESLGGEEFFWDFGDGNTSTEKDSVINIYNDPGTYKVTLRARDINTCTVEDIASTTISVYDDSFAIGGDRDICGGTATQISATGGVGYTWTTNNEGVFVSNEPNPIVRPDTTTVYEVNVVDANGCIFNDSLTVNVVPEVQTEFIVKKVFNCESVPLISVENISVNSENYHWDFGDGNTSDEFEPFHTYQEFGTYNITLTSTTKGCTNQKTIPVTVGKLLVPNVVTLNQDAINEKFLLTTSDVMSVTIFNRWGKKLFHADAYQNEWPETDINSGVYYYEAAFPDGTGCNGWIHVIK